jgi:hypothetical protein
MRPTIKTTIGTHQVEYNEFITPRELHAIHDFQHKNPQEMAKLNEMLLRSFLVEVDGSRDNVVDTVLDTFRIEEYTELQERIASVIDSKKKSETQSTPTKTNA